jgi:hypothetical protein
MITREWYLFLQGVFTRVGGANGASTPDIMVSLFEDAGSSETNALIFELGQSVGQNPPQIMSDTFQDLAPTAQGTQIDNITAELSALQDRVSELVKELDSIKQGPSV